MIVVDMPPATVRNSDPVRVESLRDFTTAHRLLNCPSAKGALRVVTAVQALVHLRAQWCPRCMGRRS